MLYVKAPSIWHINASQLSKLALPAESFLTCAFWEMQDTTLRILLEIFFCLLLRFWLQFTAMVVTKD